MSQLKLSARLAFAASLAALPGCVSDGRTRTGPVKLWPTTDHRAGSVPATVSVPTASDSTASADAERGTGDAAVMPASYRQLQLTAAASDTSPAAGDAEPTATPSDYPLPAEIPSPSDHAQAQEVPRSEGLGANRPEPGRPRGQTASEGNPTPLLAELISSPQTFVLQDSAAGAESGEATERAWNAEAGAEEEAAAGVDLSALESLAESNHPQLRQARARVSQARGNALQAGLPYNPVFQYQSEEMGSNGVSGLHAISIGQRVVTAGKLEIAQQQQLHVVEQRLADYEWTRLRVLTRVRAAFAAAFVTQQRAEISRSIAELAKRSAAIAQSLYDSGEVSRIALVQTRVEAQRAELEYDNALTRFRQNRRQLAAAAGVEDLPAERLRGELPEDLSEQPWEELVDRITTLSPQLGAATAQIEQARDALRLACAQVTPDVTAQAGVGYDAGSDDTYARVNISVPLPIRNRNQGKIRAARARLAATSAQVGRRRLELRESLAQAVGRYEVARQNYVQLQEEISPAAKESFELAQRAFESGEADFLQVLNAQRTWFDTLLAALTALQEAQTAQAEIEGALSVSVES